MMLKRVSKFDGNGALKQLYWLLVTDFKFNKELFDTFLGQEFLAKKYLLFHSMFFYSLL